MKGLILYTLVFPILVYGAVRYLDSRLGYKGDTRLLIAACVLFAVSVYLPSPTIDGMDTQWWTHMVGGGVFCGLIWVYYRRKFARHSWAYELVQLLALTSFLGVVNELYELAAYVYLNGSPIADTSWDLLANTLGAMTLYIAYKLFTFFNDRLKK
ncbi:MAG: hypothetical protein WAU02_02100 [Candidatus Saccharimonadales bacterium]